MLGKLLKYDFKWINKVLCVHFIILFILSIAVRIVESMEQTLLLVVIDKIVSAMFISCVISIIITCTMRIWSRFINNVYKDESYLTHTLPVTKNQIFNAKILSGILSLILSALVIVICVAISIIDKSMIETIKVMYQSLVNVYGGFVSVCFVIGLVLLVLLEVIYLMMSGIFGIVVGYRTNNYKVIKSIIVGIASYGVLSVISFIILGIMSKYADFNIVASGFPSLNTLKIMGLTFIIVYLVYDLAYYFVSKKLFNKGVNVD